MSSPFCATIMSKPALKRPFAAIASCQTHTPVKHRILSFHQSHYNPAAATSLYEPVASHAPKPISAKAEAVKQQRSLRAIPLPSLLRSVLILSVSVLPPRALEVLIRTLRKYAHTIENSRVLQYVFRKTLYENFCIGSDRAEISRNIQGLRQMGMSGIILNFSREAKGSGSGGKSHLTASEPQMADWTAMNVQTVDNLKPGDYIAVKPTGAGEAATAFMKTFTKTCKEESEAVALRKHAEEYSAYLAGYRQICESAQSKDVKVMIDAEGTNVQAAINVVTLDLMRSFNTSGRANVLNTYQMYMKSSLDKLKADLETSATENFTLGAKLVRGAYIGTEPDRSLIHDNKQYTDDAFNAAVRHLMADSCEQSALTEQNRWTAEVMLATHNAESVELALALYQRSLQTALPTAAPSGLRSLTFGQLMGMADDVSFRTIAEIRSHQSGSAEVTDEKGESHRPHIGVYKYTVWGSFGECLLYMLRRAEENKDAVLRSRATFRALLGELFQRVFSFGR